MQDPETFTVAGDDRFPNSALPVLLYRTAVPGGAAAMEDAFGVQGWSDSWRDGIFGYHHFHSTAHEVLGVARGQVAVLMGGPHGRTIALAAGDVVVIPAGVAHCNVGQSADLLVVGAYPAGMACDLLRGDPAQLAAARRAIAALALPAHDPVPGRESLRLLWAAQPAGGAPA